MWPFDAKDIQEMAQNWTSEFYDKQRQLKWYVFKSFFDFWIVSSNKKQMLTVFGQH